MMRMFLSVFMILCLLAGCGNAGQMGKSSSPQNSDGEISTKQTQPNQLDNKNNAQIAKRLENIAKRVPDFNGVNCVVIANTAIVGIDVDGNLERARVGTIKYSVAEALRKDPYGVNAIVTADLDINARLREISRDIQKGRPVAGFANELADIIGRIMPQLPRDTAPPARQQEPGRSEDAKKLNREHL